MNTRVPNQPGVLFPVTANPLPRVARGEGVYLFDDEGRAYLDASSGAVAANLGHGNRTMAAALADQAKLVAFAHRTHFRSHPVEQLANLVGTHAPGDLRWCLFTNSGSEANEIAIRLALTYASRTGDHSKRRLVSRRLGYHGSTMGALSLTGQPNRRAGITDLLHDYPVLYDGGLTPKTSTPAQLVKELDALNPNSIAAVFTETVGGGSGGAIVPPAGYYEALRAWCDANDVVWVADEVMCGFGRTGRWFAIEHWDAVPDIIVYGKGVSGGYAPLAGVVTNDAIASTVLDDTGYIKIGHTYTNIPITAAVGVAAIGEIERRGLVENARVAGDYLGAALTDLCGRNPILGYSRGIGLMRAVELVDPTTGGPWDDSNQVVTALLRAARSVGLLLYPAGHDLYDGRGVAVMITPPLIITRAEAEELVDKLERALVLLESELSRLGQGS